MIDQNRRSIQPVQLNERLTDRKTQYDSYINSQTGFKQTMSRVSKLKETLPSWAQGFQSMSSMHKLAKSTTNDSTLQHSPRRHFPPGHVPDYERLHKPRPNRYCECCNWKYDSPGKKSMLSIGGGGGVAERTSNNNLHHRHSHLKQTFIEQESPR